MQCVVFIVAAVVAHIVWAFCYIVIAKRWVVAAGAPITADGQPERGAVHRGLCGKVTGGRPDAAHSGVGSYQRPNYQHGGLGLDSWL